MLRALPVVFVLAAFGLAVADTGVEPEAPQVDVLGSWRYGLSAPGRLATDNAGNVWVSEPGLGRVVGRQADGKVLEILTDLGTPTAIGIDASGRLLVGDSARGRVSALDADGAEVFAFGAGDDAFELPLDIGVDRSSGRVYVVDGGADLVRVFDAGGTALGTFGGTGEAEGLFDFPAGIHVDADAGEIFVTDQRNYRVQVFDLEGTFHTAFGEMGEDDGELGVVQGVWVDDAERVYLADAMKNEILVFDTGGNYLDKIGESGRAPGQLRQPADVVIDTSNRLFVASTNNARLEILGIDGYTNPEAFVPSDATIDPQVLVRDDSPGTIRVSLEAPGAVLDDVTVVTAAGVAADTITPGDVDLDGFSDLVATFDESALLDALPETGLADVAVLASLTDGRSTYAVVVVEIDEGGPTDTADSGDAGSDTGVDDSGEPEDSAVADDGTDPADPPPTSPEDCGCAGHGGAAWLLAPGLLLARRRRRA